MSYLEIYVVHADITLDILSNRSEIEGRKQPQIQLKPMMLLKVAFVQMIETGITREVARRRREVKTQDDSLVSPGTR